MVVFSSNAFLYKWCGLYQMNKYYFKIVAYPLTSEINARIFFVPWTISPAITSFTFFYLREDFINSPTVRFNTKHNTTFMIKTNIPSSTNPATVCLSRSVANAAIRVVHRIYSAHSTRILYTRHYNGTVDYTSDVNILEFLMFRSCVPTLFTWFFVIVL